MSLNPWDKPLPNKFFDRNALDVAPDLLGKHLVRKVENRKILVGRIVETEAYTGDDPAFHAWGIVDGPTGDVIPSGRGYDLFAPPGYAYVYLCYGMYWMLNVVTDREGVAGCVLIRALQVVKGHSRIFDNRPNVRAEHQLADGPGKLTIAMEIDKRFHRADLCQGDLYFAGGAPPSESIETSSRIGITRAIDRQWRFFLSDNPCVSPGIPSDVAADRRRSKARTRSSTRR